MWRSIEQWLAEGLAPCRDLPGVMDVRVRGAIGVVELERIDDLNALRRAFVEKGAFIRPIGNVIYLAPALTIGEEDVAFLTRVIGDVLKEVALTSHESSPRRRGPIASAGIWTPAFAGATASQQPAASRDLLEGRVLFADGQPRQCNHLDRRQKALDGGDGFE